MNRERWRVSGVSEKGSTTRVLSLKLKAAVTIEDVPHQEKVTFAVTAESNGADGLATTKRRPTKNKNASENFMDEVEAEEAAAMAPEKPKKPETPPSATEKRVSIWSYQKNLVEAPEESKVEALQGNATENCVVEAAVPCDPSKGGCEAMEGIVSMSAKRGHGDTVNDSDVPKDASGGSPPPISALTRRMSFKPKPNIPPDGRPEAKPPK
ncbi:hypothetical protein HPB50_029007 [Hyalomma asiaticum]|nr:hypothetical protein HPB50_029007 [Hyalomma asiaticum]